MNVYNGGDYEQYSCMTSFSLGYNGGTLVEGFSYWTEAHNCYTIDSILTSLGLTDLWPELNDKAYNDNENCAITFDSERYGQIYIMVNNDNIYETTIWTKDGIDIRITNTDDGFFIFFQKGAPWNGNYVCDPVKID